MATNEVRNGQAEYGVTHAMEDKMREAGQGVFEKRAAKALRAAPENKAKKKVAPKKAPAKRKAK